MEKHLDQIKRSKFHIDNSLERLGASKSIADKKIRKIFLKRESTVLLERAWSVFWHSLNFWFKSRF